MLSRRFFGGPVRIRPSGCNATTRELRPMEKGARGVAGSATSMHAVDTEDAQP
jgi:hypothetical protein